MRRAAIPVAAVTLTLAATDPVRAAQPSDCPVAPEACAFALRLNGLLAHGDVDAVARLLRPEEVECPGPTPMGLGGPYPLCDGALPGERRMGAKIIRLNSEGGMASPAQFAEGLRRVSGYEEVTGALPQRIVALGCPDSQGRPGDCRDRLTVVYAAPPCADGAGRCVRPLRIFPAVREGASSRFTTFIGTVAEVLPPEILAGGRTEHPNALLIVPQPATAVTFFAWMPAAPVFPVTGTGTAADPEPDLLMLLSAAAAILLIGWCAARWLPQQGRSDDHRW